METNDKTEKLIDNFQNYINRFEKNNPFSGPSEYFYINKVVNVTKEGDYNQVFTKEFIEFIYATLAAWGMHRMGPENKGPKMNDFNSFMNCIIQNKDKIIKLKDLKIDKTNEGDIEEIKKLYLSLGELMKSKSRLVATTKVMHFLLPHLIPPMDREYTMRFFGKHLPTIKSNNDKKNIDKEVEIFEGIFKQIIYISKKVDCSKFVNLDFSPTVPKVIDNAIVSYIKEGK